LQSARINLLGGSVCAAGVPAVYPVAIGSVVYHGPDHGVTR